ncbi:MAG: hypothetical protein WDN76_00540 [Alphaproteobacteria bacterium]
MLLRAAFPFGRTYAKPGIVHGGRPFGFIGAAATATAAAGLSMAMGALLAGVLLAETEYRRQIETPDRSIQGIAARRVF